MKRKKTAEVKGLGGREGLAKTVIGMQAARDKRDGKTRKIMAAGIGISVVVDPIIGVPVGAVGIARALRSAAGRRQMEKRLLRNPKEARLVAEKARGSPYQAYFENLAKKAGRQKQRQTMKKVAGRMAEKQQARKVARAKAGRAEKIREWLGKRRKNN